MARRSAEDLRQASDGATLRPSKSVGQVTAAGEPQLDKKLVDSWKIKRAAFHYYNRLDRLERYVESHLSEKISLTEAAQVVGLEKTYFSRFFHEKTGVCFSDWVRYERVRRACALMRNRNHSITTIALMVGFNDLSTFERAFKKFSGTTAQRFKSSVRPS